jgi:hypothetical protein
VAATENAVTAHRLWRRSGVAWQRLLRAIARIARRRARTAHVVGLVGGALGGALTSGTASAAANLPEDRADVMYHHYQGGGLRANGPAVLVRKKVTDQLSLQGQYYVDMVSNASIDVVTQASKYKETRNEYTLGGDYIVRDTLISVSKTYSKEPDYIADTMSIDVAQDVFGGMTTINLGFTRGDDDVGSKTEGFFANARHWRYRLGATQILSPTWLISVNTEAVSDEGFLGNPYRAAQEFGTFVEERMPRTRSSRAIDLRTIHDIGGGRSIRGEYRYFWDNWDIKAHTFEVGHSRFVGEKWLLDFWGRYYMQDKALFYSDNATTVTTYLSRNRQLSTHNTISLGSKGAWTAKKGSGYEIKLNASYEFIRYSYKDFTDVRSGEAYKFDAHVIQLFMNANF